jgi:hypothetical protein
MRFTIAVLFLIVLFAFFKFLLPTRAIDYPVTGPSRSLDTIAERKILYHVQDDHRFLGADIYRPPGFYNYLVVPAKQQFPVHSPRGRMANQGLGSLGIGVKMKLPEEAVQGLGLKPVFGFWESYGRWFLLACVCLIIFLIMRVNRGKSKI